MYRVSSPSKTPRVRFIFHKVLLLPYTGNLVSVSYVHILISSQAKDARLHNGFPLFVSFFTLDIHASASNKPMLTCFSDRASWIDYILITNLMHWLLFIHKILFSSTCFEPQVLVSRRIQLYTFSTWYCHSLWEFLVICRYRAWVRTDWRRKVVGGCLKTETLTRVTAKRDCIDTICLSWWWARCARNM